MGIKPASLHFFWTSLHNRGITSESLATEIGVSGGVIRRLVSGHRKPAGPTWRALVSRLTESEKQLLNDTVEQSGTWNNVHRPVWTAEKASLLTH